MRFKWPKGISASDSVGTERLEHAMKNINLVLIVTCMALAATLATSAFAASKTNRVNIRYVPPENPAHQQIYEEVKQRGALEKLQRLLSPFRFPKTLQISLDECDEPDAFYDSDDHAITVCYEYIADLLENMPKDTTPYGIAPFDTVIGPLFEVSLHEVGHALFDIFELPVLGREEDAADQVAAYILLQFGESEARRLIAGTTYAYSIEEQKADPCRSLADYADEHGTPAQRAYNLLCIAYGSDTKFFKAIVGKGYLPRSRAEFCEEEYEQVQDAFELLLHPHIDLDLAEKIRNEQWLE